MISVMKIITESEWRKLFSKSVRERMDILDINQKDLSYKIGITPSSISRYLRGSRTPKIDIIVRIASVLECSTDHLINFGFVKLDDNIYGAQKED